MVVRGVRGLSFASAEQPGKVVMEDYEERPDDYENDRLNGYEVP
jgi:hypothetical protein